MIGALLPKIDGRWKAKKTEFVKTFQSVLNKVDDLHKRETSWLTTHIKNKMKVRDSFEREIVSSALSSFHSNKVAMINWRDAIFYLFLFSGICS